MAGAVIATRVSGLQELNRAFARLEKTVASEIKTELLEAAEPVRELAESYAFGGIRNIGNEWGEMRLGATMTGVYLVPATRRSFGSPRPKFGPLLLNTAMVPAAEQRLPVLQKRLETWLDRITREEGF